MLQDPGKALRALLSEPGILMAPGIYDGISARVAEQAGFRASYLSGAGVATSYLGEPDIGLTNGSDVADVARRIAVKANTPFMTDADTGYGNPPHHPNRGELGLHSRRAGQPRAVHDHGNAGLAGKRATVRHSLREGWQAVLERSPARWTGTQSHP